MTLEEQITLYALGALDEREAKALEQHLQRDPSLRARLDEERAAAAMMLVVAQPVAPSPRVKQQLMQRVDASLVKPSAPAPKLKAAAEQPYGISLNDVLRWLFRGLSIAAAAVALVLGIGLIQTQRSLSQLQSQVAQLQTGAQQAQQALAQADARAEQLERDLTASKEQLTAAQQDVAQARDAAEAAKSALAELQTSAGQAQADVTRLQTELGVLSQADVRSATLPANSDEFENGAVTVFFAPKSRSALITVANLPALASDQDYQVWLIRDGVPLPSSVFDTAVTGDGRLIVTSDEPFEAYQSVGITVEPAGGRPTPNPEGPIFLGPLS
jgi:anti-sigma-K factor RskA